MKTRLALALAGVIALVSSNAAAAPEKIVLTSLKNDMSKVAQKLLDVMAGEHQSAVSLGQIAAGDDGSNFGQGLADLLQSSLETIQQGVVQPKAELKVVGSYAIVNEPRLAVQFNVEVRNRRNQRISEFIAELTGNVDIAQIAGVTVAMPPEGTREERAQAINKQIETPTVHVDGAVVRTSSASKFGVEVRAKPVGSTSATSPRAAKIENGHAVVPINQGELYEIVIHNDDTREIAAVITIDGLSVFTFSEVRNPQTKGPAYSNYIVAPGDKAMIPGWHFRDKGPDNYSSFLVTEYGKGASVKAPRSSQGDTGVITVAFSYTSPEGKGRGSETGFGPPRTVDVKPVKRAIDPAHELVTIRYVR